MKVINSLQDWKIQMKFFFLASQWIKLISTSHTFVKEHKYTVGPIQVKTFSIVDSMRKKRLDFGLTNRSIQLYGEARCSLAKSRHCSLNSQ